MLLFLLAAWAYGWYAKKPQPLRYLAVAGLFVLGLAAKPMVITLPFVLLLLDWWPLQRIQRWTQPGTLPQFRWTRVVLEKVPLLALSAGSAVITLIAQQGAVNPAPFGIRLGNAVLSYSRYIWNALWPLKLAAYYPLVEVGWWRIVLSAILLAALSVVFWRQRFRRPWLITGWLFYLGTLVPVIGFIQVGAQAMADRYMYLPGIGLFVIAVWTGDEILQRIGIGPRFRLATAALVLAVLGLLTWRQVGFWRDSIQLWTHALAVTDNNLFAEDNLADALLRVNRNDEALVHFKNASRIDPTDPTSSINIAADLQDHGRLDEAIAQYQTALNWTTESKLRVIIYHNLGNAYRRLGDLTAAQEAYLEALKLQPENGQTMERLGRLRIEKAVQDLRNETSVHPSAAGFAQLGDLLRDLGRDGEARDAYAAALKLEPKMVSARQALLRLSSGKP
jgi:tetratricopeptide (TPR) repeat protein